MVEQLTSENIAEMVDGLTSAQKVERSLALIDEAYQKYGDRMVVANSLGKDSVAVWHLAKRVSPHNIKGFIITTRYKPAETVQFMHEEVERYPELRVFPQRLPSAGQTVPNGPGPVLLQPQGRGPTRQAIEEMDVDCWVTGLRCTEGRTRTNFLEIEERDEGLLKLNPILLWYEREIWQYLALQGVKVNPLYNEGYRSLGCAPCTSISTGPDERAGRWVGTSKCGGECGIHTKPLKQIHQPTA